MRKVAPPLRNFLLMQIPKISIHNFTRDKKSFWAARSIVKVFPTSVVGHF